MGYPDVHAHKDFIGDIMVWTVLYSNSHSASVMTNGNDYSEALLEAKRLRPTGARVFAIIKGSHTDTVRFY